MAKCYIRVKNEEQLKAATDWGRWDALIIDAALIKSAKEGFERACQLEGPAAGQDPDMISGRGSDREKDQKEIYIDLPDVARESRSEKITNIMKESSSFTGVVIRNIDELGMVLEAGYEGKVIGDPFLYAFNNAALDQYLELIPDMMFIANDELTDRESEELRYSDRMIRKIYGYQQLMITAQCLNKNHTGCREKKTAFKDDKGNAFYSVSRCDQCYSIIYNGLPTSMLDKTGAGDEIFSKQAAETETTGGVMLDFTIEDYEQVKSVLRGDEIKTFTRGHHYKETD